MKKTILIICAILTISAVFADADYYSNRILFSLNAGEDLLTKEHMRDLITPYAELNYLIKKYKVVKIEPWLSNATEKDHDGDVYLNRIYRLKTSADIPAPFVAAGEIANASNAINGSEPEPVMRTLGTPDDPMIGDQWYLYKAQVQEAWGLWDIEGGEIPGNRNIVVAVVDDGVEYTHPDLWKNIWINQDEIPSGYFNYVDANSDGFVTAEEAVNFVGDINGNGVEDLKDVISSNSVLTNNQDDDLDGYVDNIIGWDTDADGSSSDDDNNPMVKDNDHGTHVAGLVGATTGNNTGIASAAYNISIMPVKATGDETVLNINTGWDGILYAAQAGADFINCSWGGPGYSSYAQNIINNVYNNYGALVIAAAGNGDDDGNPSDEPHYPSGYDKVVSVTAVSSSDHFSWANYGFASGNFYGIDLAAPGETMLSTVLTKAGSYGYKMGTSMASPFVASCFALLKSVYPDSSNDWLVDRMLSNTDPIDDVNPDYAGQLGTGRVNILKALASDQWPSLDVENTYVNILSGDGDAILNPGESINLMLDVKNDTGWADATNLIGVLRTSENGINISDSIATWSVIPQNRSALNDGDGYFIEFSGELLPGDYEFELLLESATDEGFAYSFKKHFILTLSLDQEGFPFKAGTEVEASPLFADIDNDGDQEIFFGDIAGNIYGVDHRGDTLQGFPVSIGTQVNGLALADIDLDDTLEIAATGFEKVVSVFDVYGNHEWSRHTDILFITAMPAIGNLDDDAELEIVFGSYDQNIYVLNHDSTDVAGFPYATGELQHNGVSLADLDADGKDDIVYISKNGQLGIIGSDGAMFDNMPVNVGGSTQSEPQVIIIGDDSPIIIWGNDLGEIYGYHADGTRIFKLQGEGAIKASPAIFFPPNSTVNAVMAYFATTSGNLYKLNVWSTGGTIYESWTKKISPVYKSLVLVDLLPYDMSTVPYVLAVGDHGYIYAYNENTGNPMPGFPIDTKLLSKSSLAAVDLDNDGDIELINGNYSGIAVTDLKMEKGDVHWAMHRGSADRRGSMKTDKTGVEDIEGLQDVTFELIDNYPNPFNPSTTIKFTVAQEIPVKLSIYSLTGKLVAIRTIRGLSTGLNEISINMNDHSSGIYFYTMEQAGIVKSSKMILLK